MGATSAADPKVMTKTEQRATVTPGVVMIYRRVTTSDSLEAGTVSIVTIISPSMETDVMHSRHSPHSHNHQPKHVVRSVISCIQGIPAQEQYCKEEVLSLL